METNTSHTKSNSRGKRNEVVGVVISDKMQKTLTVEVSRMIRHNKYGKYLIRQTTFKAHDENGTAKMGDLVKICQSRPLSKTKRWSLVEVVEKSKI